MLIFIRNIGRDTPCIGEVDYPLDFPYIYDQQTAFSDLFAKRWLLGDDLRFPYAS